MLWPRTPGQPLIAALSRWLDDTILELGREMRISYLPPLMVYMAAGISGLTAIVGTFFVKDYLDLSAEFLAALGFWMNIPWSLKMPFGHLVDLIWRWKSLLVILGASLIAVSLLIMIGLLTDRAAMAAVMPINAWFVLSTLLAPVGYMMQDSVADAMTVEAVPHVDDQGRPVDAARLKLMHTTMQTLGRVAIIGGTILVALVNLVVFSSAELGTEAARAAVYREIYSMALAIPLISVAGIVVAMIARRRQQQKLLAGGVSPEEIRKIQRQVVEQTAPNWWILGGGLAFVVFTLAMGFSQYAYNQEVIFAGSLAIVAFLIVRLTRELSAEARQTLIATAIIIFVFRAVPATGPG